MNLDKSLLVGILELEPKKVIAFYPTIFGRDIVFTFETTKKPEADFVDMFITLGLIKELTGMKLDE